MTLSHTTELALWQQKCHENIRVKRQKSQKKALVQAILAILNTNTFVHTTDLAVWPNIAH